jgi:hypothetical protein
MIVGKQHVTAFPGLVQAVPTKKPSVLVRRPMYNPIAGVIHIRPPKSVGHSRIQRNASKIHLASFVINVTGTNSFSSYTAKTPERRLCEIKNNLIL